MIKNKYAALLNQLRLREEAPHSDRNDRVLIVDGLNTFIRAYSSSPALNANGEHVGGISGFLLSVGHAIKTVDPTRVVVVFDGKNGSAKRRQLFPEYKANRKVTIRLNRAEAVDKEDNQLQQLMRLIDYLEVQRRTCGVQLRKSYTMKMMYIASMVLFLRTLLSLELWTVTVQTIFQVLQD